SGSKKYTSFKKTTTKNIALFIIFFLFSAIGYFSYTKIYSEDAKNLYRNFYLHFTSSENYIDHYYKDYGFGSHHFYDKEEFKVESISDSLLEEIRSKVFAKISASFSNQDVEMDASFYEDEREVLDEFLFIKINEANDDELEALRVSTDKFSEVVTKRIDYYKDKGLPDVLGKLFVYKVKDLNKNEEYLIADRGATWGEYLWDAAGNVSWSVDQNTYNIDSEGVDKLIERSYEWIYAGIS
ncbi:uncharacterized protein METZ01_LOCUS487018, partial [marine metagenome]